MSEEMIKKLDDANVKLDLLLQWRAGLEERCKSHLEKTEELRTVLFDNPGGLVQRVDTLNNCKRDVSKRRDYWLGIMKTVVAACIISLIIWLLSIYREHSIKSNIETSTPKIEREIP